MYVFCALHANKFCNFIAVICIYLSHSIAVYDIASPLHHAVEGVFLDYYYLCKLAEL